MDRPTMFVTGAASGIGQAVARRFAAKDWFVGLYDIDEGALAELHDVIGAERSCFRAMDVTDPRAIRAALDQFGTATAGRMDVLLNSAGVMTVGRFEQVDLDAHRRMLDVNLQGVINVTRLVFPLLRDTPRSRVVTMGSASGVYGTPELATYSATKAGVRALTQALNLEWAHHDIFVCDVMPPYVDSPMTRQALRARSMDRLGIDLTPDHVADVVEQALVEDQIHWPVGKQFTWLYRVSEMLPSPMVRLLMRYVSGF